MMIDFTGIDKEAFYKSLHEVELQMERHRLDEEYRKRQKRNDRLGVLDGDTERADDDSPRIIEEIQVLRSVDTTQGEGIPGTMKWIAVVDRAVDNGGDVMTYILEVQSGGSGKVIIDIYRNDPVCKELTQAMYEKLPVQISFRKPKNV